MSDLTEEELALLDSVETPPAVHKARRNRKAAEETETVDGPVPAAPTSILRGPLTPAQYDDDGWGGLPVQMRG